MLSRAMLVACVALIGLTSGCKSATKNVREGSVSSGMILPPFATRYQVSKKERFLWPDTTAEMPEMPVYPANLLAEKLPPQRVCLEVVITEAGQVRSALPLLDAPGCPTREQPARKELQDSAAETVLRWQYFPAAICRFPPEVAFNNRCEGPGVAQTLVPVTLGYYFDFVQKNGRPIVTGHRRSGNRERR